MGKLWFNVAIFSFCFPYGFDDIHDSTIPAEKKNIGEIGEEVKSGPGLIQTTEIGQRIVFILPQSKYAQF